MRLDLFSPGDSVLLLGEGNFSFAVCLLKHRLPIFMVATCFERDMTLEGQAESIHFLEENEVPVYLNVSATQIHEHRDIAAHKYSKVVFNFPHVGGAKHRANIQEHRDLLREMFRSARKVVRDDGQMLVSLCRGQGGTEVDLQFKPYEQSWQIAEMGAHGDFILTSVEPYVKDNFLEYKCHDAEFSLKGALVHVFSKCDQLFPDDIDENVAEDRLNPEPIFIGGQSTPMPTFMHDLYERNPIETQKTPASFFKEEFMRELRDIETTKKPVKVVSDEEIPLTVYASKGVPVGGEYDPELRLRTSPLQIINDAIYEWENFATDGNGLIYFPGVYFGELITHDFNKIPPASVQFLLFGKNTSTIVYRYIHRLARYFEKENLACYLRPRNAKGEKMPHHRDTVEKNQPAEDNFKWQMGLEWVYSFTDQSQPDCVVCEVFSLFYNQEILEACVLDLSHLTEFYFGSFSWREIFSDRITLKRFKNAPPEVRVRKPGMNPPVFQMEATLHLGDEPFEKETTYRTLWLAAGHVIEKVEKLSDSGNVMLIIRYRSEDVPLYRERVADIHYKIVCKMLSKALGVCVS